MGVLLLLLISISYALQVSDVNYQAYSKIPYMARIEDFPDVISGDTVKRWMLEDTIPVEEEVVKNANLDAITEKVKVSFGWTKKRTNMRMYPTDKPIYGKNKDIDLSQYTLLEPLTFLAVLHTSKDGMWLYAQSPFMRGWVKKEDVLIRDKEEVLRVKALPFLVVLKPRLYIGGVEFGLGSRVPYVEKQGKRYRVLLPDGSYRWVELSDSFAEGYLPYSEERVKGILSSLLGEPYDWGGKNGSWDCSALVKDVFSLFGLELPRNSSQQMQIGIRVTEKVSSYHDLKEILTKLPPFRTLIFFKGHVMIYGGIEEGDPVVYHALYGIVRDDGSYTPVKRVEKNRLERDMLTNIYRRIVSINVLP
ncbi:NlpC/P60 family protein [Hydrogenobacter thermophilus]|uniref:NlpC/P60 family protein n=1 Tax=Hydrogenobacter thermophilus TaxID=940 RepID=UPI0030FA9958